MPRRQLNVAPLSALTPVTSFEDVRYVLEQLIRQVNEIGDTLAIVEAELRGDDGNVPKYENKVDMNQKRLTNLAWSKEKHDAVPRSELEANGAWSPTNQVLRIRKHVIFERGFTDNTRDQNTIR